MTQVSVRTTVYVDLDEIDTDDLVEELESRSRSEKVAAAAVAAVVSAIPPLSSDERHPLHEIYYALKFGLDERALQLMRAHLADELGVVL